MSTFENGGGLSRGLRTELFRARAQARRVKGDVVSDVALY
jgi:hypothetical protein